jgi:hypothetical protein
VVSIYTRADICKLESVQRRFTKSAMIAELIKQDSRSLISESLQLRRLRSDIIVTYKILFGLTDVSIGTFFQMRENSATRGHRYKLHLTDSRIHVRKYFFSLRIVHVWNNLNPNVISFTSLSAFVNSLSTYDMSQYVYF